MNEYEIVVTEILKRKIKVEATTYEEAVLMIEKDYKDENIVLDSSDCVDVNIG